MSTSSDQRRVWVGQVEVKPQAPDTFLGPVDRAFAATVALVSSPDEFASLVTAYLSKLHLEVVAVKDVVLLATKLKAGRGDQSVVDAAAGLTPEDPVATASFETP
jgi:hypothetical protein